MPLGEQRGIQIGEFLPVGGIVVALALLLLHDVTLVVQVGLVHRVEEMPMAIRLEPQSEVERARGDGLEVVRPVEPGRRIETRTNGQQSREGRSRGDISRAL